MHAAASRRPHWSRRCQSAEIHREDATQQAKQDRKDLQACSKTSEDGRDNLDHFTWQ